MQRETEQPSLADVLRPQRSRRNRPLRRIDELLEWAPFAALLAVVHALPRGRKACHALPLPQRVGPAGLGEPLFAELQRQLAARHVILQQGRAAIDAGLVDAQGARARAGAKQPPSDPDAARVRRRNVSYYGCKMHLNVDLDTRLIAAALLTPANVHETRVADQLPTGRERSVHADRAYDRKSRRALYDQRGIAYELMQRANRYHPLTPEQQARNHRLSRERPPMEGVFGTFKRGYVKVRCRSLRRNHFELYTKCIAYNLRRLERLAAAA